jgi:DNA polymerase I-like protein with 3'-5' exonuclease and polymerase domains
MHNSNIYSYITTQELLEQIIDVLTTLSKEEVVNVGIDFEGYVKDEYRLVSSGLDCYCNKLRLISINWIGNDGPTVVVELNTVDIKPFLNLIKNNNRFIVWAHNAAFEIRQIKHHYNIEMNNIYCSMVMFNTLYVSIGWRQSKLAIGSSLGSIMRHFAGVVMDKTLQTSDWSSPILSKAQLEYSAMDVNTKWLELCINVKESLISYYEQEYAFNLDQDAMRILAIVEYVGFNIDKVKMNSFIKELEQLSNDTKIKLARQLDQPLSVSLVEDEDGILQQSLTVSPIVTTIFNNPKKLGTIINSKFKVNLTALNAAIMKEFLSNQDDDEDEEDTDDVDLEMISNKQEAKEVINTFIVYKRQEKLITEISKYNSIVSPITGALHATTNPVGAGTGRMSSSSSIIVGDKKFKMNLQQVIARGNYDIRSGFVARQDYVIAGIDYSSEEVLTAMAFAKDEAGLAPFYEKKKTPYLLDNIGNVVLDDDNNAIENPYTDAHLTAAIGLCPALANYDGRVILKKSKGGHDGTDYRFQGKILNFSVIYGKTEQGLSEDLKCSVEEAAKVLHSYFSKYYKLKDWLDRMSRQAIRCKRLRLPTGRIIWVDESNSHGADNSAGRKGPNSLIQGFCADQLKVVLPYVRNYLEEVNNKYNIRNNIVALVHSPYHCAL